MTAKRFTIYGKEIIQDKQVWCMANSEHCADVIATAMNELAEENEQLKQAYTQLKYRHSLLHDECIDAECDRDRYRKDIVSLEDENEQLKQDNNALIHLLENQSMIIQELHSKLLEYQVKEPIVLTKEDLNLMGKAISYYTNGRCPE